MYQKINLSSVGM